MMQDTFSFLKPQLAEAHAFEAKWWTKGLFVRQLGQGMPICAPMNFAIAAVSFEMCAITCKCSVFASTYASQHVLWNAWSHTVSTTPCSTVFGFAQTSSMQIEHVLEQHDRMRLRFKRASRFVMTIIIYVFVWATEWGLI